MLYVRLESFLAFLMLALQRENLIVGLACLPRIVEALLVRAFRVIPQLLNGIFHFEDAILGEANLMAHARDSVSQVLVVSLDVVQEDFLVLQLVL